MDKRLVDALGSLELDYDKSQLGALSLYLSEIEFWNPTYKLIAADHEGIIYRHILDSLAPLAILEEVLSSVEGNSLADLGSGNGMPGIPLSIMLPSSCFTLIERSGRRAGFLRNALAVTSLSGRVSIIEEDITSVRQQFDMLLFRAFRPLKEVFSLLDSLLLPGGVMFAYKGQLKQVEEEIAGISDLLEGRFQVENRPYKVPGLDAERTICLISKLR